jgi:MFS family permease
MTIGWGSTYYIPAILAPSLRSDLDLTQQEVFGGVTVMLLVSAAVAPAAGRLIERRGAQGPMMLGSVMVAAALAGLSQAQGLWTYMAAWVLIGLATPLALTQGAVSAVAERADGNAHRAVSALLLLSGFSSTIFWPLTTWLAGHLGWRTTCLAYAALHLSVCFTLHALLLRRDATERRHAAVGAAPADDAMIPSDRERPAFVLTALALSLAGVVSWGLPLQMVEILTAFGHPLETAVWIAALIGPSQVLARIGEVTFGRRAGIINIGLISACLMPLVTIIPMVTTHSVFTGVLFVVGYGIAAGAMTIVRSVLPLALFGRQRYARLLGLLSLPQNVAFALSPVLFASVMSASGPDAVLGASLLVALAAAAALAGLARMVGTTPRPEGGGSAS